MATWTEIQNLSTKYIWQAMLDERYHCAQQLVQEDLSHLKMVDTTVGNIEDGPYMINTPISIHGGMRSDRTVASITEFKDTQTLINEFKAVCESSI